MSGTSGAGGADPSMEEILASIRRILSEDTVPGTEKGDDHGPAHPHAAAAEDGVFTLDASMMVREPGPEPNGLPGLHAAQDKPAEPPAPVAEALHPAPPVAIPETGLVAPAAAAAAATSLGSLRRTLESGRQGAAPAPMTVRAGGPTIEELVREELRPVLKSWLDAHLPGLVERLVQAEIARVVSQGAL